MKTFAFSCALLFLGGVAFPGVCFETHNERSKASVVPSADPNCDNAECEQAVARFLNGLTQDAVTWSALRGTMETGEFVRPELSAPGTYNASGRVLNTPSIQFDISVIALQPPDVESGPIRVIRLTVPAAGSTAPCIRMNELASALGWSTTPQPPIALHNGASQHVRIGAVNGAEVRVGSFGHHYPCVDGIALFQLTRQYPPDL